MRPEVRWSTAVALMVAASALAAACSPVARKTSEDQAGTPPVNVKSTSSGAHWQLAYQDQFNGFGRPKGWNFLTGGFGWGFRQLQWNSTKNAYLNGRGDLVIAAIKSGQGNECWYGACRYSAARIQTLGSFSQAYGRFEARIKLPAGRGLWPAFWMVNANTNRVSSAQSGEIDIIEVNDREPDLVSGYAHGPKFNHTGHFVLNSAVSNGYHVFGIVWTPSGITWTVDGRAYSYTSAYKGWPFSHPFYMILDLAVGGGWPGPPNMSTVFPAHMLVDWVRVYREIQ